MSLNTGNAILSNAITVDGSYNVGIGGSPSGSYKFEINGTSRFWDGTQGLVLRAYTGGAGFGTIYSTAVTPGAGNFALAASSTATILSGVDNVSMAINSATKLYINSSGNVGIGTTTPNQKLEVNVGSSGNGSNGILNFQWGSGANQTFGIYWNNSSSYSIYRQSDGAGTLRSDLYINSGGNINLSPTGNVGIGTSSPATKLDINTGAISNDGYSGMRIADDASHFWFLIRKDGSGNKRFAIYNGQGSTPITLQEGGGNLGIGTGTTLPVAAVEVGVATPTFRFWNSSNSAQGSGYLLGSIVGANTYAYQNNLANEAAKISFYSGSPWYTGEIRFYTNGSDSTATSATLRMTISQGGNIGAPSGTNIYNASDLRLKRNISTIANGLDKIIALNPVKFNWIENYEPSEEGKDMLGFIAQEVEPIIPEAVESFSTGASVHIGDLVVENPLRVNEKFIIPVLVKAIQELNQTIQNQQQQINQLINK